MKKLSFILPCYNVEHYIVDCLNGLYAQNLSEAEFEVICVNDCSTDGTRKIIVDYAALHQNLILIDHTENLTAGGARNSGIKVAKGEYIWFVDPDDMVKTNSAGCVYEIAKGKDVDILMFNYEIVDEETRFLKEDNTLMDSEILRGQDFVTKYFPKRFSDLCIVWRCLFRLDFLKERNLWYPIMRKAQDVSFLWKVLLVAERVASVSEVYYTYRSNPYSVANKSLNAHVAFSERILFANEIRKMLERNDVIIKAPIRQDMEKTLKWCTNSNLELLWQMTDCERSRYFDEIVNHRKVIEHLRSFMNRKHKAVFTVVGGKRLWMFKLRLIGKRKSQ